MHKLFIISAAITTVLLASCESIENMLPGRKTCDGFSSQSEAQKAFEGGADYLDGDNDGVACEEL